MVDNKGGLPLDFEGTCSLFKGLSVLGAPPAPPPLLHYCCTLYYSATVPSYYCARVLLVYYYSYYNNNYYYYYDDYRTSTTLPGRGGSGEHTGITLSRASAHGRGEKRATIPEAVLK